MVPDPKPGIRDSSLAALQKTQLLSMLALPSKKSLPLLYGKALSSYIQNVYQKDPTEYEEEMKRLDELRQATLTAPPSLEGVRTICRYMVQLKRLPDRFPIGEEGIKVNFSWFNFAVSGKESKKPCTPRVASHM